MSAERFAALLLRLATICALLGTARGASLPWRWGLGLACLALWLPPGPWGARLAALVLAARSVAASLGSGPFAALAPLAQAARYASPLAASFLAAASPGSGVAAASWALRLGAAGTFLGHGIECLGLYPPFLEYLQSAAGLLGSKLDANRGEELLLAIGIVDIGVAAATLIRPWRPVLGWMALWGFLTAGVRVVHGGTEAWHEAVLRAPHGAAPLALFLLVNVPRRGVSPPAA